MERRWDLLPLRRAERPSPWDAVAALALAVISLAPHERAGVQGAAVFLIALGGSLPVAARRVIPVPCLVTIEGFNALQLFVAGTDLRPAGLGAALAMYSVARTYDRATSVRVALAVGAFSALCVTVAAVIGRSGNAFDVVPHLVLFAGSWAIGDNVRTRQAYLQSLRDRAERAELEREDSARRAVLEERARIARELHDVVAHHVSAIAVTAGAAEETAVRQPERAREALRSIRATSRQALSEMRAIVGVLQGAAAPDAELGPQPGLADVSRLVEQSRAAGLEVALTLEGSPRALPEALDLTAYRIVQEALTNTMKHAAASRAEVSVRYGDDVLELVVVDDGRGANGSGLAGDRGGRGLVGMRERVALFRGELVTGREPAGGYRVAARLPLTGLTR